MRWVWVLGVLGCGESDPAATADATVDATVVEGLAWQTEATQGGYITTFSGPAGASQVVTWTGSRVRIEATGRAALGPLDLGFTPADAAAAERGALVLRGAYVATFGAAGQPFTGLGIVGNHAGCDDIDLVEGLVSCGRGPFEGRPGKGGCCDIHDACISTHCTGCGDSGNVVKCLFPPGPLDCSDACTACHEAVVRCFVEAQDAGHSRCCAADDCGAPQQCMIDDVVITDACACEAAGVESAEGCAPCVADGQPGEAADCCSGRTCAGTCCPREAACP